MNKMIWKECVTRALQQDDSISIDDLMDAAHALMKIAEKKNPQVRPYLLDLGYMLATYNSTSYFYRLREETFLVLEVFMENFDFSESPEVIELDDPIAYANEYIRIYQNILVLKSIFDSLV